MSNSEQTGSPTAVLPSTRVPTDLMARIERFSTWLSARARRMLGEGVTVDRPDAVRNLLERGLESAEREMGSEAAQQGNAGKGDAGQE